MVYSQYRNVTWVLNSVKYLLHTLTLLVHLVGWWWSVSQVRSVPDAFVPAQNTPSCQCHCCTDNNIDSLVVLSRGSYKLYIATMNKMRYMADGPHEMATELIDQREILILWVCKRANLSVSCRYTWWLHHLFLYIQMDIQYVFMCLCTSMAVWVFTCVPFSHAALLFINMSVGLTAWRPGGHGFLGCGPHKKSLLIYFPPNWKVHAHTWLNHHASMGDNPPRHTVETWGRENTRPCRALPDGFCRCAWAPGSSSGPHNSEGLHQICHFVHFFLPSSLAFFLFIFHTHILPHSVSYSLALLSQLFFCPPLHTLITPFILRDMCVCVSLSVVGVVSLFFFHI